MTETDFKLMHRLKAKECREAIKKFRKKKKTHLKDPVLKDFYMLCKQEFNPMLYTIPFRCYFSLYLYLYLKNKAEKYDFDKRYHFLFSKPMEINVSGISRVAKIPLNTVKSALRELIQHDFILYSDNLTLGKNKAKSAIIANDHFIIGYDTASGKTCFYNKQRKFSTIN